MSVGIDLTGEGRKKAVCIVIFKDPTIVTPIYEFLLKKVKEKAFAL